MQCCVASHCFGVEAPANAIRSIFIALLLVAAIEYVQSLWQGVTASCCSLNWFGSTSDGNSTQCYGTEMYSQWDDSVQPRDDHVTVVCIAIPFVSCCRTCHMRSKHRQGSVRRHNLFFPPVLYWFVRHWANGTGRNNHSRLQSFPFLLRQHLWHCSIKRTERAAARFFCRLMWRMIWKFCPFSLAVTQLFVARSVEGG